MALVQDSKRVIIRLQMPCSLLYALKVLSSNSLEGGPEGGTTGVILKILRDSRIIGRAVNGYQTGRFVVEQLDKLYGTLILTAQRTLQKTRSNRRFDDFI